MARRRAVARRLARLSAALAPSSGSGDSPPSAPTTDARRPPAFNISLKRETTQLPPRRFTPADDPPGTHGAEVTDAEVEFFRNNGCAFQTFHPATPPTAPPHPHPATPSVPWD